MRVLKLVSATIVVLASGAIAVASASAAETSWLWLPGAEGTRFTGKSGKTTLQLKGSGSITCPESTTTGELTEGSNSGVATIRFGTKCNAFGLPVENEGSKEPGVITARVKLHNCLIKPEAAGIKVTIEELKLFVPAAGLQLTTKGAYIVAIGPRKKSQLGPFALTLEQKEGAQAIQRCEGGEAQSLLTRKNGEAFVQCGLESKEDSLTFEKVAQEVMV